MWIVLLVVLVMAVIGMWIAVDWVFDRYVTPWTIRHIATSLNISEEHVRAIWSELDAGATLADMNLGKETPMRERERELQGARPEEADEA